MINAKHLYGIPGSLLLLGLLVLAIPGRMKAQVRGLVVEKYYRAGSDDLTDSTGGRFLEAGSVTYRVFVELELGSRITQVFGDTNHLLRFTSTRPFYNNNDRPSSEFGYEIKTSWFSDNPLLALDSWLTIGYAATNQKGILKPLDNDGDLVAGTNNNGGTSGIPGGILVNNDTTCGLPLTQADGLVPAQAPSGQWTDFGFKDAFGNDTTVFGPDSSGSEFACYGCVIQQNSGVNGPSPDSLRILIAQLTTAGEISFVLNLEVEQTDSAGNKVKVKYVADDRVLLAGEQVSSFLSYPPVCGCNDPDYLEYSGTYACLEPDSCRTLIVFGCMDTSACNYNPSANVNLSSLCCYPGLCNDRDISKVCPDLSNGRNPADALRVIPNPTSGIYRLQVFSDNEQAARLEILDSRGLVILNRNAFLERGNTVLPMDASSFSPGVYLIRVISGDQLSTTRLIKLD